MAPTLKPRQDLEFARQSRERETQDTPFDEIPREFLSRWKTDEKKEKEKPSDPWNGYAPNERYVSSPLLRAPGEQRDSPRLNARNSLAPTENSSSVNQFARNSTRTSRNVGYEETLVETELRV